jgi:uncharacterized protein YqeY
MEKLNSAMVAAAKSKDKLRLSTIRMVKSSIKYKEIETKKELETPDIIQVLSTMAKQRTDSLNAFKEGGRDDLAAKEEAELTILKEFLPAQLSREEIVQKAKEVIEKVGASDIKDLGKVMKEIKPLVLGRAPGKEVSSVVKELLTSN